MIYAVYAAPAVLLAITTARIAWKRAGERLDAITRSGTEAGR